MVPSLVCAHIDKKIGDGIRLQDLNSELEGRVWKHYKIWCRQCKVPGCGHRFNLSRFGRESWVTYPELHSCYKAYTVKMMIYWVHAFLSDEDVGVPGGDDRIHVSYSLSKMQWAVRPQWFVSGYISQGGCCEVRKDFPFAVSVHGCGKHGSTKKNFKIVPKFHSLLHLLLYVKRTSRNPRLAKTIHGG